jgi:hypothetical protein
MDVDGTETWVYDYNPDEWSDSAQQYWAVGDTYKAMAPFLEETNRRHADASIGVVIGGYDQTEIDDLEAGMECYYLVLKPQRVSEVAEHFSKVDFDSFPKLFDIHCPDDHRDILLSCENDFQWYVSWTAPSSAFASMIKS